MSRVDDLFEQITARAAARADGRPDPTAATVGTGTGLDTAGPSTGVPCDRDAGHDDAVVRLARGSGPTSALCPRCLTAERRSVAQMIRPLIVPIPPRQ